jgi:glycosyltransferase involved in cell wall biosynthesis
MKKLDNILIIGNFGKGWDNSICDEKHISDCLALLGYKVTELQREMSEHNVVEKDQDLIIISQWDNYPKNFIKNLKQGFRCPVVFWAFDYQEDGQAWHEEMVKECDLYLSPLMDSKYPNHQWLPQAFAPMFLDKVNVFKEYDVVFTGTYLPQGKFRTEVLKAVDEKFNLHIFSVTQEEWKTQGLKNVHPPVMDYDLPELYGKSKIVLSVDLFPGHKGCWSDRNAQAMACGACVIYKYAPLSEEEFQDGVVYFNTIDECLSRIQFLLDNKDIAKKVAEKGHVIARSSLMAIHRVKNLITILENTLE